MTPHYRRTGRSARTELAKLCHERNTRLVWRAVAGRLSLHTRESTNGLLEDGKHRLDTRVGQRQTRQLSDSLANLLLLLEQLGGSGVIGIAGCLQIRASLINLELRVLNGKFLS